VTTAEVIDHPELSDAGFGVTLRQTLALARRSVLSTLRQPPLYLPSLFFPLLIAAVNSAALTRATDLPGWPVGPDGEPVSFLTFVLAASIVQAVMLGAIVGGADVALDIEDGFFERLLASPVSRLSILVGRLAGAAVLGAAQAVIFVVLFRLVGVEVQGGLAGIAVIVLSALLLAVAVGALAAAIGLRTGLQEAVNSSFPLIFILLFISSAFFPTGLMKGWYQVVAEHNPLTWIINGMRYQVITGFDLGEAVQSVLVAGALAVVGIVLAVTQLRRRLAVSS
jgi:ABC-2 type transport system permease protein